MTNTTRTHVVAKGESFSSISKIYGINNYQALMKFNSMQNERQLLEGQRILIPRTRLGYEITISKLQHLKNDMLAMTSSHSKRLDIDKQEFERINTILDTIGTAVTIGWSVYKTGSKVAIPIIKKVIEGIAESAIDKGVEYVINKNINDDTSQKVANLMYKGNKEKWKLVAKYAKEGLKIMEDADSLVNVADPSTIAWAYTKWASGGESAEDSEKKARKMIEDTNRKINDQLRDKIDRLINERKIFYGI